MGRGRGLRWEGRSTAGRAIGTYIAATAGRSRTELHNYTADGTINNCIIIQSDVVGVCTQVNSQDGCM